MFPRFMAAAGGGRRLSLVSDVREPEAACLAGSSSALGPRLPAKDAPARRLPGCDRVARDHTRIRAFDPHLSRARRNKLLAPREARACSSTFLAQPRQFVVLKLVSKFTKYWMLPLRSFAYTAMSLIGPKTPKLGSGCTVKVTVR